MSTDDPYEILGVSQDAGEAEIKSAYRELALEYHPDHNPDDEASAEAFKRVSWAYDVLSDRKKRRRYDRGGLDGLDGGGRPDFSMRRGLEAFREVFEMFGAMFGMGSGGGRRPVPGDDLETSISLDIEAVLEGTTVEMEVPAVRTCTDCGGDGAAEGASVEECGACDGRGQTRGALMSLLDECERCGGTGTIPSEACSTCGGNGREHYERRAEIDVPAGVRDGQVLRRKGEGAPGRFGGTSGDLRIAVDVEIPDGFERSGGDLRTEASVSFTKASLGGEVRVETVDGDVWMEVPAGTSSGDTFRLAGKGVPDLQSGRRGDQLVTVYVETPVDLTDRQRERLAGDDEDADSTVRSLGRRIRDIITGSS